MKKSFFVFGFSCDIKETKNTNILVTRIEYYANFEKKITTNKDIFSIGIEKEKNRGKFDNGTDQVFGGSSDFGRASNCIATKVQSHYVRMRIVTSRSNWLHNPNKLVGFESRLDSEGHLVLLFKDFTYSFNHRLQMASE